MTTDTSFRIPELEEKLQFALIFLRNEAWIDAQKGEAISSKESLKATLEHCMPGGWAPGCADVSEYAEVEYLYAAYQEAWNAEGGYEPDDTDWYVEAREAL